MKREFYTHRRMREAIGDTTVIMICVYVFIYVCVCVCVYVCSGYLLAGLIINILNWLI